MLGIRCIALSAFLSHVELAMADQWHVDQVQSLLEAQNVQQLVEDQNSSAQNEQNQNHNFVEQIQ